MAGCGWWIVSFGFEGSGLRVLGCELVWVDLLWSKENLWGRCFWGLGSCPFGGERGSTFPRKSLTGVLSIACRAMVSGVD